MKSKYKILLYLARNLYIDLSKPENLFNANRSFKIYKWDETIEYEFIEHKIGQDDFGRDVRVKTTVNKPIGGWIPWLHYSGYKWQQFENKHNTFLRSNMRINQVMSPGHMFWEKESDFAKWLGEDLYSKLIADLL